MVFLKHRLRIYKPLFSRTLAGGCAALVVLLAILASNPALHEWLHHDAGAADHECAITLFQHGVDAGVAVIAIAGMIWVFVASVALAPTVPDLDQSRYWLPQGNAPPAVN
jgi:hypothetical protein